jgi:hypothetical protein
MYCPVNEWVDLDYISRHCIYFTISGKYWRKQNKSEGSWCRVKSILPYACDIKKYDDTEISPLPGMSVILYDFLKNKLYCELVLLFLINVNIIKKTNFSMMLVWYTAGIPHLWVYICHVVVPVPSQHFQNRWPSCYTSIHGSCLNAPSIFSNVYLDYQKWPSYNHGMTLAAIYYECIDGIVQWMNEYSLTINNRR